MGMSASQARFLCLTARKNNVEFEGQQINQQRTTLSNESASYYSELCNMSVPVPPSIDDYTRVSYTFNDGAMTNTITSLLYSGSEKNYHVSYLQQWQDDYSIVPKSSSLVQKTEGGYSVGGTELRKMEAEAPTTLPASVANDPYYQSLPDDAARLEALKVEAYYVSLLRENSGSNDADYYVRYVKNQTTGAYEPYFYCATDVENTTSYNDRNLASVPCYSIGSSTKTKEVINVACQVEQDSSGRYVAIIVQGGIGTKKVKKDNQDDIDAYIASNPAPVQSDYQKPVPYPIPCDNSEDIAEYIGTHTEPNPDDYYKTVVDSSLATIFKNATTDNNHNGCYDHVINTSYSDRAGCYKHVLAHMIDLETGTDYDPLYEPNNRIGANPSKYPKSRETTCPGYFISINKEDVTVSNISIHGKTTSMQAVSDALANGYTPSGETSKVTLMTSAVTATASSSYSDRLLSDYYITQSSPTIAQKLLSNYYIDGSGNVVQKNLRQKAIDLFYVCDNMSSLGVDMDIDLLPAIVAFQNDMQNFSVFRQEDYDNAVEEWVTNTTLKTWTETGYKDGDDVEAYNIAYKAWEDGKPKYEYWYVDEPYQLNDKTYQLTTVTTTDEDAYNDAMNDYYYQQHEYDHKIQEINAKLEIIQQQDKQLELKLKQLDTEENAISTEMDAVKKVISKNIDNSFKTFSA